MANTLDVTGYSQAKSAAKAVRKVVRSIAEDMGQDPDLEVNLKDEGDRYVLYWEGGPHDWAIKMTGGTPIWLSLEPRVTGFSDTDGFWAECKNGHAIEFGNY